METKNQVYIVAGDEMQRIMKSRHPDFETIPFREDLSKGHVDGFSINRKFIEERAAFWGVTQKEYRDKFAPIIDLDLERKYVLCFGEDDCCQANLKFMVGYLRCRGYDKPIQIRIVNEYDLTILEEYSLGIPGDRTEREVVTKKLVEFSQVEDLYYTWLIKDFPPMELKSLEVMRLCWEKEAYDCFGLFERETILYRNNVLSLRR